MAGMPVVGCQPLLCVLRARHHLLLPTVPQVSSSSDSSALQPLLCLWIQPHAETYKVNLPATDEICPVPIYYLQMNHI